MIRVDYEKIKKLIGDIYEENSELLSTVPIDVFELARKMGFRIIKASQLVNISHNKALEFQDINKTKEVFGFSFFDKRKSEYVIYVDDVNAKINKQRFSVAHEIGHITLGHIDKGIKDEKEAEDEADYFAGYLLCPECIGTNEEIYKAIFEDESMLCTLFQISVDTALIKYRYICNRVKLRNNNNYEYEKIIMGCLENSILEKIRK